MSYLYMIAVDTRKQRDKNRAIEALRKRKKNLDENEEAKRRASYAGESDEYRYSYLDCILMEMLEEIQRKHTDSTSLVSFFMEFEQLFEEVIPLEDSAELIEQGEGVKDRLRKAVNKQKNIQDRFDNASAQIEDKREIISKLGLNIEMLQDESTVKFRERYEKLTAEGQEQSLPLEIEKLKKEIKYLPFKKDENESLLKRKEDELAAILKAKSDMEMFESLTKEDKSKIFMFLLLKKELHTAEEEVNAIEKELEKIKRKIHNIKACLVRR